MIQQDLLAWQLLLGKTLQSKEINERQSPLSKETKYSFLHVELGKQSRGADWSSLKF